MLRELITEYGLVLVGANVLLASLGLPVPALPTLILTAAITMAERRGLDTGWSRYLSLAAIVGTAVASSSIGDTFWFLLGRKHGNKVLAMLCKMSVSRDTCVTRSGFLFRRFGVKVLTISKFIPGLSTLAIPVAGATGITFRSFLINDVIGVALWASVGVELGVLSADAVDSLLAGLEQFGQGAMLLAALALVGYVALRWWRRATLLRRLRTARVSPLELAELLLLTPAPQVIDARQSHRRQLDPFALPGALHLTESELGGQLAHLAKESALVIYCDCPNDITAALAAEKLVSVGYPNVKTLRGGLDAWREAGLPLEEMRLDVHGGAVAIGGGSLSHWR